MNGHRPPNQPNGQPLYIGFDTPGDNAQEKANEAIGHAQAAAAQAQAAQAQANAAHAQAAQAHAAAAQAQANVHAAPPTPPPAAIYVPVHTGYQTRQNMVAQSNPDPGIHYPKKKRANFFGMLGTAVGVGAFAAPVAPVLITGAACSTLGLLFHRKWWAFAGLLLILCNPGTHRLIHHAMDPHGHHAREVKRESGRQLQRTNRSMDKAAELIEGSFVESGKWPADVDGNMICWKPNRKMLGVKQFDTTKCNVRLFYEVQDQMVVMKPRTTSFTPCSKLHRVKPFPPHH